MILPVASDVKISWNGATSETAEKVMIGSRFEKQLDNLKEFLKIRDQVATTLGNRATGMCTYLFFFFFSLFSFVIFSLLLLCSFCSLLFFLFNTNWEIVTLQLTFMEVNLKEIPDVVRLAISLGVDRIKGMKNIKIYKI